MDHNVDFWAYHDQMYSACLREYVDVENIDALSNSLRDLLDVNVFRQALQQGTYRRALTEANELAFERSGVWVVPAYRMDSRKIDPVENVGVSKEQLRHSLDTAN